MYSNVSDDVTTFKDSQFIKKTKLQKQLRRGVLIKRCSENLQQIYRKTPISKCDFNKIGKKVKPHFAKGVFL